MLGAVYVTSWIAVLLFVVGDAWRARGSRNRWPRMVFTAGLLVMIVHTLLAFARVHGWSHAAAVASTARQTEAVYGLSFGAGIYVNYLFLAVWMADVVWWRRSPVDERRPALTWMLRAFYMLILFNAAVVFAAGWRRVMGLLLTAMIAAAWVHGPGDRPR